MNSIDLMQPFLLNHIYLRVAQSYERPTPKRTHHWGVDKSYEFIRISHLVKYERIGREIALGV